MKLSDDQEEESTPPADKRRHQDQPLESFGFSRQGEWVAVFYYDTFHIGQVLDYESKDKGQIKFLERTNSILVNNIIFKWPRGDDIQEVASNFVIHWESEVSTSQGRLWHVQDLDFMKERYLRLKEDLLAV